jgi:hypothetical protein
VLPGKPSVKDIYVPANGYSVKVPTPMVTLEFSTVRRLELALVALRSCEKTLTGVRFQQNVQHFRVAAPAEEAAFALGAWTSNWTGILSRDNRAAA